MNDPAKQRRQVPGCATSSQVSSHLQDADCQLPGSALRRKMVHFFLRLLQVAHPLRDRVASGGMLARGCGSGESDGAQHEARGSRRRSIITSVDLFAPLISPAFICSFYKCDVIVKPN